MNLLMFAYVVVLFYVLSPGILLRIPKNGSKMVVAAVHGVVFAIVYKFTHRYVWMLSEGFQAAPAAGAANGAAAKPVPKPAVAAGSA